MRRISRYQSACSCVKSSLLSKATLAGNVIGHFNKRLFSADKILNISKACFVKNANWVSGKKTILPPMVRTILPCPIFDAVAIGEA